MDPGSRNRGFVIRVVLKNLCGRTAWITLNVVAFRSSKEYSCWTSESFSASRVWTKLSISDPLEGHARVCGSLVELLTTDQQVYGLIAVESP